MSGAEEGLGGGFSLSQALEKPCFLVKLAIFPRPEIIAGDYAHNFAIAHHRQMAEAAIAHHMQRIHGIAFRRQADGVARHGLGQADFGTVAPMGKEMHRIAAGEYAKEAACRVRYQYSAHTAPMHGRASFLHGRIRPHGQGVLVADHFSHAAFLHGFLLSSICNLDESAAGLIDPTQV
jgi:hypothetical protein